MAGDPSAAAAPEDGQARVLGAFLHDFSSALTPIAMWVDLALDPRISEDERLARLRTIEGLVRRMGGFVSTLRGFVAGGPREAAPLDDVPAEDDRDLEAVSRLVRDAILLVREGGDLTLRAARAGEEVRIFVSGADPEVAAARAIVESQGGPVRAEGSNGSAFSFLVPRP